MGAGAAVAATSMFLPFAAVQVGRGGWPAIDGSTWALILFYSIAGSVIAFLLWFQGLRRVDAGVAGAFTALLPVRSEEHTSELQSLMRISYAVFCLKKKKKNTPRI